jgi:hypothetical protein
MYKSNTRIVTCVYYSLRDSEMGGRSWPIEYYKWTLFNIFNFKLPITLFYDGAVESLDKLNNIITEYKNNISVDIDIELLPHNLKVHPLYDKIIANRKSILNELNSDTVNYPYGFNWARNEVICHTKLTFLKKVFELHTDVDNLVWVDAGITHWGLNPRCYGGMEINGLRHTYNDFYPFNTNNIFNPKIGEGFNAILNKEKLFFIGHDNNWYSQDFQRVNADYVYSIPEYKQLIDPEGQWVRNSFNRLIKVEHLNSPKTKYVVHNGANEDPNINGLPINIFGSQIVGGVIGINREKIDHLYSFYNDYLVYIFNHDHRSLFTEEPILSLYYCIFDPYVFKFSDWNHNVPMTPPNPCTTEGLFEKSFYTVWTDISNVSISDLSATHQ